MGGEGFVPGRDKRTSAGYSHAILSGPLPPPGYLVPLVKNAIIRELSAPEASESVMPTTTMSSTQDELVSNS